MKDLNFWEANFVTVDVETTGNSPTENRIIDIAAVTVLNGEINNEFSSLINPHQFIPPFIANMTGITNEAVFFAPEAQSVIPKFLKVFDQPNSIFVAHNANFDFNFVKATVKRATSIDFDFPVIDTLKLARRLLPESQKKSVGNLAAYFGIRVRNRHTALGDAKATAKILIQMLEIMEEEHEVTTLEELMSFQNRKLTFFTPQKSNFVHLENKIEKLPDAPGVYHFLDSRKKIIYVGKAKSLKNRTGSYFKPGNITSPKLKELTTHIKDMEWTETFNELSALLLEAKEIKLYKPKYNFAGTRLRKLPFLKITTDELFPRIVIVNEINDDSEYYGPFTNRQFAENIKDIIDKNFRLTKCDKAFNLESNKEPCLYSQMDLCLAPCAIRKNLSVIEDYKIEVQKVREFLSGFAEKLLKLLEEKMNKYSDDLEFEKANEIKQSILSVKKIFNNSEDFINSINNQNFILILPVQNNDKLVDIFFFKYARLKFHQTLGKKDFNNSNILKNYKKIFLEENNTPKKLSLEEIEEIKITNSWLAQNKENGKVIYIEKIPQIENLPKIIENSIIEIIF